MKLYKLYGILTALFVCLAFSIPVYSQNRGTQSEQKADLLYSIPKYLIWENGRQSQTQFMTIGLVNTDEEITKALKKNAKKPYPSTGTRVIVKEFLSVEDAVSDKSVNVYYLPYTGDFVSASNLLKYTPVVLISDNYPNMSEVMIDFSDEKSGLVTFAYNSTNIKREGISILPNLTKVLHGEDISKDDIIKEQSEQLSLKEDELNQKLKLLEEKEKEIFQKQQQIEIQNRNMAIQSRGIQNQVEKLERQKQEMQSLKIQQDRISKELQETENSLAKKNKEVSQVSVELEKQKTLLQEQQTAARQQQQHIDQINDAISIKENELKQLNIKNRLLNNILLVSIVVSVIFLVMLFFIAKLYIGKRRDNQILELQNEKIEKQNTEITAQKDKIVESIRYAQKIQQAVMPPEEYFSKYLPDHFIMLKPKDIVSGDFYWGNHVGEKFVFTAADCTGHGVPGAFMSLLGIAFLNDITARMTAENITAGDILTILRSNIITYLRQSGKEDEQKDGMDMAICVYDKKQSKIQYAGAHNPLIIIRDNTLTQTDADEMPIGYYENQTDKFTNHEIDIKKGDMLYMFSDGYSDQFGIVDGKRRKYMIRNFRDFLLKIHNLELKEQKQRLDDNIENWRGNLKQLDDILVVGVRF